MRILAVSINGILDVKNILPLILPLRAQYGIEVDLVNHWKEMRVDADIYDAILVGSDWNENRDLVDHFNLLGKRSILVQSEGLFIRPEQWYARTVPICGLSCLWGPIHKDIFLSRGYHGRMVVTGCPRLDHYRNFRPTRTKAQVYERLGLEDLDRPYIAFLGQYFNKEEWGGAIYLTQEEITRLACAVTSENSAHYAVLKSHPQETAGFARRSEIFDLHQNQNARLLDRGNHSEQVEMSDYLYYSDAVISFSSTGSLEGKFLGKLSLIFDPIGESPLGNGNIARLPVVSTADELIAAVRDRETRPVLDNFLEQFTPGEIDGTFTERVCREICMYLGAEIGDRGS